MSLARKLVFSLAPFYVLSLGLAALLQFRLHAPAFLSVAVTLVPVVSLPAIVRRVLHPLSEAASLLREERAGSIAGVPREIAPFLAALSIERERTAAIRTREKGYFDSLAHEFRGCLGILQARVDLLFRDEKNAEFSADVARLTRLVSQLLLRARLRVRSLELAEQDLSQIVRGVLLEMAPIAFDEGKSIGCDLPEAPVIALANLPVLQDGLRNLILNAIQHTPAGTEVSVTLTSGGAITVRDHGPGIPEIYHEEVFQPFWKLRNQNRNGAGLGLTIVRETALLHNGRAAVSTHEQNGAVFSLVIPVIGKAEDDRPTPRQPVSGFWKRKAARAAVDFSAIVNFSDDAIFTTDALGNITSWNGAAERIFGYTASDMTGRYAPTLLSKDRVRDRDLIRERIVQGLEIERYDTILQHRDGSTVAVSLSVSPVFNHDGVVIGSTSIARDVRERKQSQKALQEKLHLLSTITDNAAEAMFMSDADNRITFMNRAAEHLCGWTFAEIKGRCLHDAIHYRYPDGSAFPREKCPLLGIYRTLQPIRELDDVLVHRDGSLIDVAYSSAPIVVGGVVTGSVLVVHDIRDRKKAEATLQQAQKMRAIGDLTGGMAHDFNNVLAIIIANLDALLEEKTGSADAAELASNALQAAISGSELTRRLLAFARRQSLRPEPIALNALIEATVRLLRRTLGQEIEIELALSPALGTIVADPAQLEATLTNLAANARDAMPAGGRLAIRTRNETLDESYAAAHLDIVPGAYVVMEVSDTGAGMPPEVMSQIFEPFFSTKDSQGGTGLGLSMVFGFIKQSGGHVAVSSIVGQGSCFRLYFPLAGVEAKPSSLHAATSPVYGKGQTVLAVEDSTALRLILIRHLKDLGYRTLEAADAAAALGILEQQPVDLLFTDVVMPGMSGFDLVGIVRRRWPATRIVVTSGFPELKVSDAAPGRGNVSLVVKPYRKDELSRALADALG